MIESVFSSLFTTQSNKLQILGALFIKAQILITKIDLVYQNKVEKGVEPHEALGPTYITVGKIVQSALPYASPKAKSFWLISLKQPEISNLTTLESEITTIGQYPRTDYAKLVELVNTARAIELESKKWSSLSGGWYQFSQQVAEALGFVQKFNQN